MKSLLISSTYFPPQIGGISNFMARVAIALGPDRVCSLTGVPANQGAFSDDLEPRVYRRPVAFSGKAKHIRALSWGMSITQIMIRERPRVVQLETAYDC